MNGYAAWSRVTGAIPCARASAQLTRPFRLSSQAAIASGTDTGGAAVAGTAPRANAINSVEAQPDSTRSNASASRWSMVSPYRCRTVTTRAANQQRFCAGSHSAASRSTFSWRFTRGPASVRFSRSVAKRCLVASPALAASSVDSRPPRPVGRREDGRQVSRTSSVRPDRPGRIRFAGQPDAEPSRRDRHQDARGADGHPGRSRSTRRGADCRGARRV